MVVGAMKNGRFPLWDPYTYAGYPFHADVAVQLFYPPAWLLFLVSAFREHAIFYWLEWFVVLHVIMAGAGAYALLRRLSASRSAALFGGTAFQLGSFFSSQPQHLGAVSGAAWIPFACMAVMSLADGITARRLCALSIVLTMIFLAGFPAVTLVAYGSITVLVGALAIQRRTLRLPAALLGAFAVAAVLSAVELAPCLQLSEMSAASRRWLYADPEGITPRALVGAIWPNYLHIFTPFDKSKFLESSNFTFLYLYNGELTAWLTAASFFVRKSPARLFGAIGVLSALAMLGTHLPLYGYVFQLLPKIVKGSAYVEFASVTYSFGCATAAALVLDRLTRGRERWAAALTLFTGVELLSISSNRPMNTGEGGWKRHDSPRQIMHDAALLGWLRSLVSETEPPWRTDTAEYNPRFTSGAPMFRLPSANGDNAFAPLRMLSYRGLYTKVVPWARQFPVVKFDSPLIDAASVGFLMQNEAPSDETSLLAAGWRRTAVPGERPLYVYRNLEVLPRFRLVGVVKTAGDAAEALRLLPDLDVRNSAVIEGRLPFEMGGGSVASRVVVRRYEVQNVLLEADAGRPSILFAGEGYAPGWKASVDGRRVPVYPANVAFMGIPVTQGRHSVAMWYSPDSLYWGVGISLAAWLVVGSLLIACNPRRLGSRPASSS